MKSRIEISNKIFIYYNSKIMYYKFRKNPLRCHRCGLKFHTRLEMENHQARFCINSKYDDPEYLDYMRLKEKFFPIKKKKEEKKRSLRQSLKLDELLKKSKELDRDIEGLEEPENRSMTEVEKLVELWRENKRIIGVQDSEVEARIRVLFDILDHVNERKLKYMNDIQMFKKQLDKTYALTSKDVVRRKALEDILVERDRLFERENKFIGLINELKQLYLRIKDYEFEGKKAEDYMYRNFKDLLTQCEFEEDTIDLRRNQILNNFETITQVGFVKYFGQRGKNIVYDNNLLKKIIEKSALRANELKIEVRDMPRYLMSDQDVKKILKNKSPNEWKKATVPDEPMVLKTRKNPQSVQDQSMVLSNIRKNIEMYGLNNGLKKAGAILIPERVVNMED